MSRDTRRGGMRPRIWALVAALVASTCIPIQAARAEEPQGCDKFRWPIKRERGALAAATVPDAAPGEARTVSTSAFSLALAPVATAALPRAPERAPKPGTFAAAITIAAPRAGTVQVNLSDAAWIDVIQGEGARKPVAFSGAEGCAGLRKAVRFDLDAGAFVLQVSGAARDRLRLIVEPAPALSN